MDDKELEQENDRKADELATRYLTLTDPNEKANIEKQLKVLANERMGFGIRRWMTAKRLSKHERAFRKEIGTIWLAQNNRIGSIELSFDPFKKMPELSERSRKRIEHIERFDAHEVFPGIDSKYVTRAYKAWMTMFD